MPHINYSLLGRTGLFVSELCFGAMTFGGEGFWKVVGTHGQEEADRLVGRCLEAGITFFGTADVYSNGQSGQLLGKALGANRQRVVLAPQGRGRTGPGVNDVGLSRGLVARPGQPARPPALRLPACPAAERTSPWPLARPWT